MGITLFVQSGSNQGRRIVLRAGQAGTIGSSEWADFALGEDAALADVQFEIASASSGWLLRHLGSTPTLLNGKTEIEALLAHGDTISVGSTRFAVEIDGAAAPRTIAPQATPTPAGAAAMKVEDNSRPYEQALTDENPAVREQALLAAAWGRRPWLLGYLRHSTAEFSPERRHEMHLLAVLGDGADLDRMIDLSRCEQLEPHRYDLLGSYGHPAVMDELIRVIGGKNPAVAIAAGRAFTTITGINIEGERAETIYPAEDSGPDDFEAEFLEEALRPDPALAAAVWGQLKSKFAASSRWRQGYDTAGAVTRELLAQLDLAGRYEVCLRGRFTGRWRGSLADLLSYRPGG